MIVTLKRGLDANAVEGVIVALKELRLESQLVKTQDCSYLVLMGGDGFDMRRIGTLPGVADVHRVHDSYQFVSRKWKATSTVVPVADGLSIAEGGLTLIAGPCSIESEEQVVATVQHLAAEGVRLMRGGVFKPRSSPYAFQGLGLTGLEVFARYAHAAGICIVSEVVAASQIESMIDHVDVFQVGTRNCQNFDLLLELGRAAKPVLIKRGMSQTLAELLQSAEYIFSQGNERLILCERGIRTFETTYRNTLDLNAIPALKEKTHLPVLVDPSHGVGVRRWVTPLALAGIMAGADGVMVEVHPQPAQARSDAQQTLDFGQSSDLFRQARALFKLRQELCAKHF